MSFINRKLAVTFNIDFLYCVIISAICIFGNSLWLANLRRPSHDTLLGFVPLRMWASGLIHSGDWPIWNFSGRYGFPFSNLYFGSGVLSPSGLLFGWVFHYDEAVFQFESATWQCIGAIGAYFLGRNFLTYRITACVVSVTFISSAVVTIGGYAGTVQIGYMGLPWVFLGLALSARATSYKRSALSIGVLVLSSFWIITSGYPQTWLVLPVFCLPFVLVLSSTTSCNLFHTFLRLIISLILLFLCVTPVIFDTIFTPLFGTEVRNLIDADDGAVPLTALFGLFLVNPTWLPGVSQINPPVYAGLIIGIVFACHAISSISHSFLKLLSFINYIFRKYILFLINHSVRAKKLMFPLNFEWIVAKKNIFTASQSLFFILLCISSVPTFSEREFFTSLSLSNIKIKVDSISPVYFLVFIVVYFFFLYRPASFVPLRRPETAFLTTIVLVMVCATETPIGSAIRLHVPPFKWVRWSYYELVFMLIPQLLMSWKFIENIVLSDVHKINMPSEYWRKIALYSTYLIILITCIYVFSYPSFEGSNSYGARTGLLSLLFSLVCLLFFGFTFCLYNKTFYYLIITSFIVLSVTLCAYLFGDTDYIVRAYASLYGIGNSTIDIFHATLIILYLIINRRNNKNEQFLVGLAVISIIDVVAAKPRYLADLDIIIGWQAPHDFRETPSFDYSGEGRDLTVSTANNAINTGRPGAGRWGPAMPQVAEFEGKFGSPPLFDQFVYFPTSWNNPAQGSATFTPESLGRLANQDLAPPVGPAAAPVCPASATPANPWPSAMVTRVHSSYVQVTYFTACTRLLAYTDTWAQGWTATIDGTPTPVLHLNGAIRGVVAPAGTHILEWSYRPAYWHVTKWFSLSGLLCTLLCLVWGLSPVRMRDLVGAS